MTLAGIRQFLPDLRRAAGQLARGLAKGAA